MYTIKEAIATLQAADNAYCEEPTPANNRAIVIAQQHYYAQLARMSDPMRRVNNILRRAQQNRKRLPDDILWQDMARWQCLRARHLYLRMRALQSLEPKVKATSGPKRFRPERPPRTQRKRTIHPITRRYVYSDQ